MPKPNYASDKTKHTALSTQHIETSWSVSPLRALLCVLAAVCCLLTTGCATPQYAIRGTPSPDESASAHQIERTISAVQGREFEQQGAWPMDPGERLGGVQIQAVVDRLSRVTERPGLSYRAYLYEDADPNAAALADGRVYISTGMLKYLRSRGDRVDELAFVLGHEIAHTVAQHIVKRYRTLQQQQLLIALVAAGASVVTRDAGTGAQQAGRLALDAASLLQDIHNSGYSQEQELEADQLGVRYVMRVGFNPQAALDLLEDFSQFENPWPFLRTHPYSSVRRQYLQQYLADIGAIDANTPPKPVPQTTHVESSGARAGNRRAIEDRRRRLRQVQTLYPKGSVSWQNLQRQLDSLEGRQ